MANLVKWIQEWEEDHKEEKIEAIVIRKKGWDFDSEETISKIISWNEAMILLDYEFDLGIGDPGCHAIYIWTTNFVLFVSECDGATGLASIPRTCDGCLS